MSNSFKSLKVKELLHSDPNHYCWAW